MNCPKCKTEISMEHIYCHKCGDDLIGRCPCGENDFNKAARLCEKKLKEAQEEEIKVNEKINKLQAMFGSVFAIIIFLVVFLVPFISRFIFNKTADVLIPLVAAAALVWTIYVIIKRKKEKIIKNFAAAYPEYHAAECGE